MEGLVSKLVNIFQSPENRKWKVTWISISFLDSVNELILG